MRDSKAPIGYVLFTQDNGTHMDPRHTAPSCSVCKWRLAPYVHLDEYRPKRTKLDLTSTYDGQTIVSARFKSFWEEGQFTGACFESFSNSEEWFQLQSSCVVRFDLQSPGLQLLKLCLTCGQYQEVAGSSYQLLESGLPCDLCVTDQAFASGNARAPLEVFSARARLAMEKAKFGGLYFEPVFGVEVLGAALTS